jgi:nucleotide-binding universal stress UspA family protein
MSAPESNKDLSVKNVLVPTDFSPCSYRALLYALAIAKRYASTVTLLHVVPAHRARVLQAAWRDIRKLETDLIAEGHLKGVSHRLLAEQGNIWDAVSEVLTKEKIDLLVMGTHGRTGLEVLVLGSFAETVFRRARCPVLTVGPKSRPATPDPLLRNILFSTDFSRESEAAEPYAFSLSRSRGAKLTLLNVVEEGPIERRVGMSPTDKDRLGYAKARLRGTALRAAGRNSGLKPNLLAEAGSTVDTVLKVADRLSIDLIVLGILPPSKLAGRLGRTKAYRIVCASHCPVLTVREPFPGPYFERLFAMSAESRGSESTADRTSTKSEATRGSAGSEAA